MKYHFRSMITGELVHNIFDVFKNLIQRDYNNKLFLNWNWQYSREGF